MRCEWVVQRPIILSFRMLLRYSLLYAITIRLSGRFVLYSLQSVLRSGYFFFVIFFIKLLLRTAIAKIGELVDFMGICYKYCKYFDDDLVLDLE